MVAIYSDESTSPVSTGVNILNFAVVGQIRSGASVVQSVLHQARGVVCHGDLFHPVTSIRRTRHESYFGPCVDNPNLPQWFEAGVSNPYRYLTDSVFDQTTSGEQAVGVRLAYPEVATYDLVDLFDQRCREGDFCVIHVLRNPISCFVSMRQAERTKVWGATVGDPVSASVPVSVTIDVDEMMEFLRQHERMRRRVHDCCDDLLTVNYRDLFLHFDRTLQQIFEFLELQQQSIPQPTVRRLRNRNMQQRISNLDCLLKTAPKEIRDYLQAEDLF